MRFVRLCAFLGAFALSLPAQLTTDQRIEEFQYLTALYAKNYAPYEWKKETQSFDLLDIGVWLDRVRSSRDDLEFYDVMARYVASLNDAHDTFITPSTFIARLNFVADIYDGKVLVDTINRTRLPAAEFPFQIGDEVVSIDGVPVEQLLDELSVYGVAANPRSTRRITAELLTIRPQQLMPLAVNTGDIAVVEMRNRYGVLATYRIPWTKTGLPLRRIGPVPPIGGSAEEVEFPRQESYMEPLLRLQNCRLPDHRAVLNFGGRSPIFQMPENFVVRLGRSPSDVFFSGTYQSDGMRIGFIRVPTMGPADTNAALNQFLTEMLYFQANTDGLVVDVMRNPGGTVGYTNTLVQLLMPGTFQTIGFEIRATSWWIAAFSNSVQSARSQGAPDYIIAILTKMLEDIQTANREMRGRTGPIPLDGYSLEREPLRDSRGQVVAYTKPLMVLIDEMSASGGDLFPATIQTNRRGILFGMRTMGAGGSVSSYFSGPLSENQTSITESLMNRGETITVEGYPPSPYIENVGVHPDIQVDYMTAENLLTGGQPFVNAFTAAIVDHIRRSR